MRSVRLAVGVCLVLATCAPALAQRIGASVRGTATDSSSAVIPGATVTVTNLDTGLVRVAVTNADGIYAIGDLPVGRYDVQAELSGFKTASRTGVTLRVADDYSIDFTLDPGEVSEVVTVEASSTPVKVLGGDLSGVVTGGQARELPLNGRNFLQLATLMPGVSAPDALNVKDKGLLGGSDLSVSGSDVTANLWTVDGANNNDVGSNRTILVYPSLDAIEEFKILRNSYGPEFGGAGGAQINIVTRGGTNQFRGSGFYSGRSDKLNSKNYFLEQADQDKEKLSRNDFGATIGGPLLKDKLHFFGSVEWNLEKRGVTRAQFVPTLAERQGDFSGPQVAACARSLPTDPATGLPFPGNRIPADRLSQAALTYMKLFPAPNVAPASGSCNNWVTSVNSPIDWNQYHGRADWTLSNSARIMVRYTQDSWKNDSPSIYTNLWGDDPFPSIDSNWDQPSRSFALSLNQTVGNNATNALHFSYSANAINVTRGGLTPELNSDINKLMPSIFPAADKGAIGEEIGHPLFWGGLGYGNIWNEAPFRNNQDLFVFKDDYTRVFGKHFFKAGGLFSMNKKNEDSSGNGSGLNSQFWGAAGLNGWGATTGNVLSDFLLRDMAWGFSEVSTQRQVPQRWRDTEFYIADSWQVSPHLTLDFGVRYSLFYNSYADDDKIISFVPSLFVPALGGDACNGVLQPPGSNWCKEAGARGGADGPNRSLMNQDFNNFAPRVGAAWDVFGDGKTAIRAGFGQFFLRERLSPGLNIAGNPPFVKTISGLRYIDRTTEPCGGCFGTSLGTPTRGREVDQVTPNNWQWNLTMQQEVWKNATLEVAYVGNYGYNLLRNHDENQVLNGDINKNGINDRLDYTRSADAGFQASVRPYGQYQGANNQITIWDHSGESTYHSLQTQFISRFARGSQFQTSYTLSRSRANLSLTDSSGSLSAGGATLDLQNPDLDWGRPETGRTHIFNAALIWLAPSLEGKSAMTRILLGDWQISGIVGASSGQPITIFTNSVPGLSSGPSGTGYGDNQRPNRTSEPCKASSGPDEQIINPAAYTLNGFRIGSIGTGERGECTGPGYTQTDMSFAKNFPLSSRVKMQIRWDIFNLFNNVNFLGVNNFYNPSSATFNTGDAATATVISSATVPGTFGQASRARDPRQMQFGIKLLW